jgi:hypothetical protein
MVYGTAVLFSIRNTFMKARSAYVATLIFTALGLMLSGYLSFYTLFRSGCTKGFLPFLNCGSNPVKILGMPQCVVGFIMYFAVAVVALIGLRALAKRSIMVMTLVIGIAGVLFSGTLSVYELWFQKPAPTTTPACVYGFFLYLGILIVSAVALGSFTKPVQEQAPPLPPQPAA